VQQPYVAEGLVHTPYCRKLEDGGSCSEMLRVSSPFSAAPSTSGGGERRAIFRVKGALTTVFWGPPSPNNFLLENTRNTCNLCFCQVSRCAPERGEIVSDNFELLLLVLYFTCLYFFTSLYSINFFTQSAAVYSTHHSGLLTLPLPLFFGYDTLLIILPSFSHAQPRS